MKVLLDPIYTNDPQFDVMCFKLKILAESLLACDDDLFIHWIVPDDPIPGGRKVWDVDSSWYPQDPRIHYHAIPTYRDRLKEYYHIHPKLRQLLWCNGPHYDIDVVITCRVPMVPNMQVLRGNIRFGPRTWSRRIYTVDDMPITSAKKHLGKQHEFAQDVMQIAGYLVADANYFMSFWIKDVVMGVARQLLSPSQMQRLRAKSFDTSPIRVLGPGQTATAPGEFALRLKSEQDVRATAERRKPFTVGFTQRFEIVHRGCAKVMDIFTKQWVYRGGRHKMRFLITSNTRNAGRFIDTEFMEAYRAPREQFWEMMQTQMDVTIVMTIEDEYSLSLLEPIMLGVPAVVLRKPYSEGTLTRDYPFFVDNETEACGLVKALFDDYPGMYARFRAWFVERFMPELERRNEWYWPPLMRAQLDDFQAEFQAKLDQSNRDNQVVDLLLAQGGGEFVLLDKLRELTAAGKLRSLAGQLREGEHEFDSVSFGANWNEYRLRLLYQYGFTDASPTPGHLKAP